MIILPFCFIWTNLACIMMIGTMCEVLHILYKGKHHMWLWIAWDSRARRMNLLLNSLQFLRKQFFFFLFLGIPHVPQSQYKDTMEYGLLYYWSNLARCLYPPFFFFFFLFQVRKETTYQFCWVIPKTKKVLPLFIPLFFFFLFFYVVFKCYQWFFKGFLLKSWLYHFFSQLIQAHIWNWAILEKKNFTNC